PRMRRARLTARPRIARAMRGCAVALGVAGIIGALGALPSAAAGDAAGDRPHPDIGYISQQLVTMSSDYLTRYSGYDGPPGDLDPADGNLPPLVNGWQEFFAHWKSQLRDPAVLGPFARAASIQDHPFTVREPA